MKTITIEGFRRPEGEKASSLRRNGQVPCNLYGGKESILFVAPYNSFLGLVYTPDFQKVDLQVEGQSYEAIMKDIQFDPLTEKIQHIDFLELDPEKKVTAKLPVNFIGTPKGVAQGGKLLKKTRRLTVKCYPQDLQDDLSIDITNLALGKTIKVGDIKIGSQIEILENKQLALATVEVPRALKGTGPGSDAEAEETPTEAGGEAEVPATEQA